MTLSSYVGRFAPSPSGPLHLGSLVSALASYLDAKKHNGTWFVRIEDIDAKRCKSEYALDIIETLESYHLISEKNIVAQSSRHHFYQTSLDHLTNSDSIFACNCTRQQLHKHLHTNVCHADQSHPHSWRLRVPNQHIKFTDRIQGEKTYNLLGELGHPILKRKDQDFSYLLAVVIDDHLQHVSHVVRGMDLIDTTAAQIYLFSKLGWKAPQYAHTPLVNDKKKQKLSKQNHAPAIPKADKKTLQAALKHLNIEVNDKSNIQSMLEQAINKWHSNN